MKRLHQKLLLILSLLLTFNLVNAATVNEVRLWRAPDYTRVVLDLSGPVEHNIINLQNPDRIVIDVEKATMGATARGLDFSKSPIIRMRSGVKNDKDLRIVLDLSAAVKPSSFLLKSNKKSGDRLEIGRAHV